MEVIRNGTGCCKQLLWLNDTERGVFKRIVLVFWSGFNEMALWLYLIGIPGRGVIIMLIGAIFGVLSDKNLKPGRFFCRLNYWSVCIYGY